MSIEFDADILATLTDEEREAIEGGDTSPEDQAALQAIADAAAGVTVREDPEDEDDRTLITPAAEASPAVKAEEAEEAEAPEFRPRYKAELPADYADQVAAVKAESDALAQSFRDGEIDFDEFQVKAQDVSERREALTILRAKSEIAGEMEVQTDEQAWASTIDKFFAASAKAGTDYTKDAEKRGDLDTFVKALANNPANNDKGGEWFLAEAHKRVNALHGLAAGNVAVPPVTKRVKQAIPATSLAHVPGGDGPGDLAGEFAEVDGMYGDDFETAIARMTPEQRIKLSMAA